MSEVINWAWQCHGFVTPEIFLQSFETSQSCQNYSLFTLNGKTDTGLRWDLFSPKSSSSGERRDYIFLWKDDILYVGIKISPSYVNNIKSCYGLLRGSSPHFHYSFTVYFLLFFYLFSEKANTSCVSHPSYLMSPFTSLKCSYLEAEQLSLSPVPTTGRLMPQNYVLQSRLSDLSLKHFKLYFWGL